MKKSAFIIVLMFMTLSVAASKSDGKAAVSREEAMRLYEASGSYYEEQLYDSAVIAGE